MNKFFELLISSYWGGCLCIVFGILIIRNTIRNPQKNPFSADQTDYSGNLGGYGLVALGIKIIV